MMLSNRGVDSDARAAGARHAERYVPGLNSILHQINLAPDDSAATK